MDLIKVFKEYITRYNLIETGESILLGVSGGPDSLTMLDLFFRLKDEYRLNIVVFHLNHMFRDEAAQEAEFVAQTVKKRYRLKAIVEKYDVPELITKESLSPEEAARKIRFSLLLKWAKKLNIKKIGLAHNKDDLAETILLNIFRGTGLKGLVGIEPILQFNNIKILHPLLNIYRKDIEKYCLERNLNPKYDPSNKQSIYTRNKLRNKVIPYIEREINPNVKDAISRMAEIVREGDNFLFEQAEKRLKKVLLVNREREVILSLKGLKETPKVLRRRLLKKVISSLKGDNLDLYYTHYQAIDKLLFYGTTGKEVYLKEGIKVRRLYDKLIFEQKNSLKKTVDYTFALPIPGKIELPGAKKISADIFSYPLNWRLSIKDNNICFCDADKIKFPLIVRNRRPGDRFSPFGMRGMKKLKDFFIDEKIAEEERDLIPIVLDSSEKIIWIAGFRLADNFKIMEKTERILRLCLIREEGIKDGGR